jgi:hypothetical protein
LAILSPGIAIGVFGNKINIQEVAWCAVAKTLRVPLNGLLFNPTQLFRLGIAG